MSTGAGCLDLNCVTATVLEEQEVVREAKDAEVGAGGELGEELGGDAGGDVEKECDRGLVGAEDEKVDKQDGSAPSEPGGESEEEGQTNDIGWEPGDFVNYELSSESKEIEDKSHGGTLVGMDSLEKNSVELVSVLPEYLEVVLASDQAVQLDRFGVNHKWGFDVKVDERVAIDDDTAGLVGVVRPEDEMLGEPEQVEVWRHSMDAFAQVNGDLGLGLGEADVESHGKKFLKVDMLDQGNEMLLAVSSEAFAVFDKNSGAFDTGDECGVNRRGGSERMIKKGKGSIAVLVGGGELDDKNLEGSSLLDKELAEVQHSMVDGCGQAYVKFSQATMESKVEFNAGNFIGVNSREEEGMEQFTIFAEGFASVKSSSQAMDVEDTHGGGQTQGSDVDDGDYRTDKECVVTTVGIGGFKNEIMEGSMVLDKREFEVRDESPNKCAQVGGDEIEPEKGKAELESHDGNLLRLNEEEEAHVELVAVSPEDFGTQACPQVMKSRDIHKGRADVEAFFRNNEDIAAGSNNENLLNVKVSGNESAELLAFSTQEFESGQSIDDQIGGTDLDAEGMVRTNEGSATVLIASRGSDDERVEGLTFLVGQITDVEGTSGSGSGVNDIIQSECIEGTVTDVVSYSGQVQKAIDDNHVGGFYTEAVNMVDRNREASITISMDGVSKNEHLDSSHISGGNLGSVGEDGSESALAEKNVAKVEESEGACFDIAKVSGNDEGADYRMDVESPVFEEVIAGNPKSVSCVEGVVAVDCEVVDAQSIDASRNTESGQEDAKHNFDVTQMTEKGLLSRESDVVIDKRVRDFVVEQPAYIEGEILGVSYQSQPEVDDELAAGQVHMIKKSFSGVQACVETANHSMDHTSVYRHPAGDSNLQKTEQVICKEENICLETFQGVLSGSMVEETGFDITQEEPIKVNQKTSDEHHAPSGETLQMNSVPIFGMQSFGSQPLDTTVSANAKTSTEMDEVVNTGASCADMHNSDEIIVKDSDIATIDDGSSMHTPGKLQNADAELTAGAALTLVSSNCKDSSSAMISLNGEVEYVSISAVGEILVGKGDAVNEEFKPSVGIIPDFASELGNPSVLPQGNEASAEPIGLQPSGTLTGHELLKEVEAEQGFTTSGFSVNAVCENIDGSQHDGKHESVKEPENQIEESNDTRTGFASTSQQATYYLSVSLKDGFSTSDLVWGKVKSHPWWPGQIIDLSGASDLALKYQKKDHFLVAYFGDKTFAWCEETHLKSFQLYFRQMEKQNNSDTFLRAISDILAEISRRIELAMACLCHLEISADVKYQKLENAGVRGKTVNSFINRVEVVTCFHPDRLLDYVKTLALLPTGGADRLELVVAQGQLKSFYRSKGYAELPVFTIGSGLVENDFEAPSTSSKKPIEDDLDNSATLSDLFSTNGKLKGRDLTPTKQKHIVEDGRKQKSLSDLMEEDTPVLLENGGLNAHGIVGDEGRFSSDKKRKFVDFGSIDIGGSKTKKLDTLVDKTSPTNSTISFKVGEFISRAASKLTSGQSIRKCHGETSERSFPAADDWRIDDMYVEDFLDIPFDTPKVQIDITVDYPSANEMLSQLSSAAKNPLKGCNFLSVLISFFTAFRNLRISNFSIEKINIEKPRAKRGRKKKIKCVLASPDLSTPDHMKDSYWSDMIFPEKDAILNVPKRRGRKRKSAGEPTPSNLLNLQSDCEAKLPAGAICPHVKHLLAAERPIVSVEEKIVDELTPTAVILHFNNSNSLPSETDLIRIFSRYGPLKEAETYVDRNTCSAKVVFKKRADAEMAFSSAGKLRTFGSALVSYRLRHFPSKSSRGKNEVELESRASTDDILAETVCEPSSASVRSQEHTETLSGMPAQEGPVKELYDFTANNVDDGMLSGATQEQDTDQECFNIDLRSPDENNVGIVVTQVEDVDMGPSYFGHDDQGNANSESKLVETASKASKEDDTAQMETNAVSDHLLLESFDQDLSYFDMDQGESLVTSHSMQANTNQDSSNLPNQAEAGEASHAVHLESVHNESCGSDSGSNVEAAAPTSRSFVADHLEDGAVLEKSHHIKAAGKEYCTSAMSIEEQIGEISGPDSASGFVGTQTLVQGTGMPSCVAEDAAQEEGFSAAAPATVMAESSSDPGQMGSLNRVVAADSGVEPSEIAEAEGTQS